MSMQEFIYWFIICGIISFNIIGNFGNVNLIIITVRENDFHSKSGILFRKLILKIWFLGIFLAITSFFQITCLLSGISKISELKFICVLEMIDVIFLLSHQPIFQGYCYKFLAPYIFTLNMQACMMLVMALDLLAALIFPIQYVFS